MIEEYYVYTQLIIATEAGPVIETDSNDVRYIFFFEVFNTASKV
jgi:hypothetical protein